MQRSKVYLFLIIFIAVVLNISQIINDTTWGDFGIYMLQVKSLFLDNMEEIYALNKFSVDNSNSNAGPYLYPWGYPLLLAPVYYFFGFNIYAFKVFIILIFATSLFVIYILFRKKLSNLTVLLLVGLFALNPLFVNYNNKILSDVPYLLFALFTIYLIQKVVIQQVFIKTAFISYFLIGIFIFCSYLIRSNGIVFLPILFACQTIKILENSNGFNFKSLLKNLWFWPLVPYLIFFLLKGMTDNIFPEGSHSHFSLLTNVDFQSILNNVLYYFHLPSTFFPQAVGTILYLPTIPFALFGIYKGYKRDYLYFLYMLGTVSIFIIWPYLQGIRFIFSFLPFYFYFTFVGFREFQIQYLAWLPVGRLHISTIYCAVVIALFCTAHIIHFGKGKFLNFNGPYQPESVEMFDFIRTGTQRDDILVTRWPSTVMLYTNRAAIRETRIEVIQDLKNAYLIIDDVYENDKHKFHEENLINSDLGKFKMVYSNLRFKVYEIGTRE